MGLFKSKSEDQWKINYIKEFNEMRDNYEDKLKMKQMEIDNLKKEIEHLKSLRNNLKPKEKQIKDSDIQYIKELMINLQYKILYFIFRYIMNTVL